MIYKCFHVLYQFINILSLTLTLNLLKYAKNQALNKNA